MSQDFNIIAVFAIVADTRNFRAASERLGVTRSAVSQAVQKLEASLGVTLFHRTTRSVRLTEAGERFLERVAPALDELSAAISDTIDRDARPRGRLRLAVSSIAESFIDGPLLASFILAHPDIELDVTMTDEEFDIVARGYDAGVRLGEVLERDMVAVPVTADQRQVVVAAPAYIDRLRALIEHARGFRRAGHPVPA